MIPKSYKVETKLRLLDSFSLLISWLSNVLATWKMCLRPRQIYLQIYILSQDLQLIYLTQS